VEKVRIKKCSFIKFDILEIYHNKSPVRSISDESNSSFRKLIHESAKPRGSDVKGRVANIFKFIWRIYYFAWQEIPEKDKQIVR
jgi:hypothetical protein